MNKDEEFQPSLFGSNAEATTASSAEQTRGTPLVDRSPLLLLAINLYAARDAFGHGDRFRSVALSSAAFVIRTLP